MVLLRESVVEMSASGRERTPLRERGGRLAGSECTEHRGIRAGVLSWLTRKVGKGLRDSLVQVLFSGGKKGFVSFL